MIGYPTTLVDLHLFAPADGDAVRSDHFNALTQEIMIVEGVIGVAVSGSAADLTARLAVSMNPSGTWKKELCCEDGGFNSLTYTTRGTGSRRYIMSTEDPVSSRPNEYSVAGFGNGLFQAQPVVLLSQWDDAISSANFTANTTLVVSQISPVGVLAFRTVQSSGLSFSTRMAVLAISQLEEYADDALFAAPPWRDGAFIDGVGA